ncbi:tektin-1-like [Synchiropus picturatus]
MNENTKRKKKSLQFYIKESIITDSKETLLRMEPCFFQSQRTVPVPDYHPHQSSDPDLGNIKVLQNRSELFRAEIRRLIKQSERTCKCLQDDINKKIDQHAGDIEYLRRELEVKQEDIIIEMDVLEALQTRVNKVVKACSEPLKVTVYCMDERKKRFPSDRLIDEVDQELLKEKELIEVARAVLQHVIKQIVEQIRMNRTLNQQIEQDLREKSQTQFINNYCTIMNTLSLYHPLGSKWNSDVLHKLTESPRWWDNICNMNATRAEQQKTHSQSLRTQVESLLEQTTAEIQAQIQTTTDTFGQKIHEIKTAKSQLEKQLEKILSEFAGQQKVRDDLQAAILENKHFLNVAQAKLEVSHQKLAIDRSQSEAPIAELLEEVEKLNEQISKMQMAATQSEVEQMELVRCQVDLEEHIKIKSNSLYIDEVIYKFRAGRKTSLRNLLVDVFAV